jgi:small subunit ribosomal protein S20
MANHASAKKRARQNPKRATINSNRRSRLKTFLKKIEVALLAGDMPGAQAALKAAQPEIDRSVAKGILHKKTAARKMSRLTKKVKNNTTAPAKPAKKTATKKK